MNCDRVRHLISDGYDRHLSLAERELIAQHIHSCVNCARFERALRSGVEVIGHLADITPSPQLWEEVHTRAPVVSGVTPSRIMRQAGGMFGAAIAVALVAALTIFLLNYNVPPTKMTNSPAGIANGTSVSPSASSPATSAFAQQLAPNSTPPPLAETPVSSPPVSSPSSVTVPATGVATPFGSTAAPTDTAVDGKTAESTVIGYFHAINLQDYSTAYGYLGSALQQQQSLSDFTKGYVNTKHDTLTITGTKPVLTGTVVVVIYLDAEQMDGSIRQYHGEYVVGYENGKPKIVDATVTEDLPATPSPTAHSTATRCKADSLSITTGYQGATGSMAGSIIFTNTGTEPCSLQGTAQVKLLDSHGQQIATEQQAMSLGGTDQQVTLEPGQQASLFFVWANWCPTGTAETAAAGPMTGGVSFQVTLPDGQGVLSAKAMLGSNPDTLVPRCDVPGQSSTLSVGTFKDFPAP